MDESKKPVVPVTAYRNWDLSDPIHGRRKVFP
jgi:hypothetical protein